LDPAGYLATSSQGGVGGDTPLYGNLKVIAVPVLATILHRAPLSTEQHDDDQLIHIVEKALHLFMNEFQLKMTLSSVWVCLCSGLQVIPCVLCAMQVLPTTHIHTVKHMPCNRDMRD